MKTITKALLATLALTLLSTAPAFADHLSRRIQQPNGASTYVTPRHGDRGATIGVYAGDRSFGGRDEAVQRDVGLTDSAGRTLVPIPHGRGQVDFVPVQR